MNVPKKKKIIILAIFAAMYFIFNYLPLKIWIENEFIYLSVKTIFYIAMSAALIIIKKKNEFEIEVPQRQLHFFWLFPLIFVCLTHPLYAFLADYPMKEEIEMNVLLFDAFSDIFVSIAEDILFVDIYIMTILDFTKGKKNRYILSITIAAITFTIAHSYSLIYDGIVDGGIELLTVFFLMYECGYLAIYFNSPVIPVVAHLIFNELNFVIFNNMFEIEYSLKYAVFGMTLVLFSAFYLASIYQLSIKQENVEEEKKELDLAKEEVETFDKIEQ